MQIQLPQMPPSVVHWITPQAAIYTQWDFWLSLFTLLLVLATAALVLVTGRLVQETRSMRQGSDKAMAEMVKHAEASAKAAEGTAAATRSLVEVGNRAWLTIDVQRTEKHSQGWWPIYLHTTLLNTGKTPAVDVVLHRDFFFADSAAPPFPEVDFTDAARGVLGPNASTEITTPIGLQLQDREPIQSGVKYLCAYGMVSYADIFEERHRTRWLMIYDPRHTEFTLSTVHNDVT